MQKTTLGVVAAFSASSSKRILGANDRIGVGCIGIGGRGSDLQRLTLKHAAQFNDLEIRAVCDVYQKNLNEAASRAPDAKTYAYHQELLERSDIDAVVVATPDHWHAPITIVAMEKGKDVYCEKPMTLHLEESLQVMKKAKETHRILQVGVQATSWSKWHKAKELVDKGMLGKIVCCQGTYSRNEVNGDWNYYEINPQAGPEATGENHIDWKQWLGSAPERPYNADRFFRFRKYWDYSGGIATDLHFHTIAPFHVAIKNDFPTRVAGMGGIWLHDDGREVPDTFLSAADYPEKYSLTVQSSQANNVGLQTLIRGNKATMYCGADWEGDTSDHLLIVPQEPYKKEFKEKWGKDEIVVPGTNNEGDQKHIDNFFECVRSRKQPNCSAELAGRVVAVTDLSVRSYRQGKVYYFDAEKEAILDRPL